MAGDCGSTCPVEGGFYVYKPHVGGNAVLVAAFALVLLAVLFLGIRLRTPFFSLTLASGLLFSAIGFVGRLLLNNSPGSQSLFALSLLGTILGPVCISGAIFLTLPHILTVYGDHLSPLRPVAVGVIFYGLAVVAASIQVVGVVFVAFNLGSLSRDGGAQLAAGGLGAQMVALLGFSGLHFWFMIGLSGGRSGLDPKFATIYKSTQFKRFLFATEFSSVLLIAYCVYRLAEMSTGTKGSLFQSEVAFMVMNGAIPLLSAALITILHPGAVFGSAWGPTSPLKVQKRRAAPPPLEPQRRPEGYKTHALYDPDIRAQVSPTSQKLSPTSQRYSQKLSPTSQRHSIPPEVASGSPGLPSHPKAAMKPSPLPSPTGTAQTSETAEKRSSLRQDRRSNPPRKMVEKDVLW